MTKPLNYEVKKGMRQCWLVFSGKRVCTGRLVYCDLSRSQWKVTVYNPHTVSHIHITHTPAHRLDIYTHLNIQTQCDIVAFM